MKKKKKTKRKKDNSIQGRIFLEDMFFGLLVALSLLFVSQCFQCNDKKQISIPEEKPKKADKIEKNIGKMTSDFPIEKMVPFIAKKDEKVAAFLVAIAKKESNWGMFSPKKNGRDCYNYWGYRGSYNVTKSGYSCFDSPGQAVNVVGARIKDLVAKNIDTPQEMLLWKCGSHCNSKTSRGAAKWVRDVNIYYNKFYD